jgi:hypothetical protein
VAVYILEESISQLIKTEKNQTPKPMPFFSLTEKTDLNERDMIKPDGSSLPMTERDMIKPDRSSLPMTEETVRLTNREFLSIISFFLNPYVCFL